MKKQIKDYIDYDFCTPNTEEVRKFLEDNFDRGGTSQWDSDDKYDYITTTCCFTGLFTTTKSYGEHIPTEQFMELIGMTKKSDNEFDSMLEQAHSLVKQIEELLNKAKSQIDLKQQAIQKELEFAEAKKQRLENHINVLKSKLK